ncbi:MAG: DNA-binding YbaB/EbfC family protein [Vicingaceae bacterium]|mgnify:FL=1|jgi:DNA-binding YbaB/EbfC family protein|tara:strand:+ start:3516 stop:3824 length:309 start_codon:yes stop_codon:yes gene_type:complete
MFGKMGDMMGKMQEMKQKSEEVKNRLDTISVSGDAENGKVTVISTGNRKITSVQINPELMVNGNKEQLENLIILAVNKALEKAEKVNETEMAGVAKGMLPGF